MLAELLEALRLKKKGQHAGRVAGIVMLQKERKLQLQTRQQELKEQFQKHEEKHKRT